MQKLCRVSFLPVAVSESAGSLAWHLAYLVWTRPRLKLERDPWRRNSFRPFSPQQAIRIKPVVPTAEILENSTRQCWTPKNTVVESRPFKVWDSLFQFSSRGTTQHNG